MRILRAPMLMCWSAFWGTERQATDLRGFNGLGTLEQRSLIDPLNP